MILTTEPAKLSDIITLVPTMIPRYILRTHPRGRHRALVLTNNAQINAANWSSRSMTMSFNYCRILVKTRAEGKIVDKENRPDDGFCGVSNPTLSHQNNTT